jgi:iron complex transport system permease protein
MADRTISCPEAAPLASSYTRYIAGKRIILFSELLLLLLLIAVSVSLGAVTIPLFDTIKTLLLAHCSSRYDAIILGVRLPQALTAVVAGAGLAVAGAVMQIILQNPLGSPFTLGIANAAAFGAAFSVMLLGSGVMHSTGADAVTILSPYQTTLAAFACALIASGVILLLARLKQASPEVMLLAGVTMNSLFAAGTMFLQYFADDVQLAAMVFWTFGDVGRTSWFELELITIVSLIVIGYFLLNRWSFNALTLGDETAQGLGVSVGVVRMVGMTAASLLTAVSIAFIGVISFVGLVAPHIARRLVGEDYRFFLPCSLLTGALLLLASDLAARLLLAPRVLPVAILTAFLGAPVFMYLLIRGYKR